MTLEIHTYLRCKRCLASWQTERPEIGLTRQGILLNCPKHGQIAHFTPEQLAERAATPPSSCGPGGSHRP
jgi:hypothetical protein